MLDAGRWHTRDDILRWEAQIALEAPWRREQFEFVIDLLPHDTAEPLQVLDVGAGGGALASTILDRQPDASAYILAFVV
jgi:2-polyprenyl-3-methyl-5-hydroxy-6-metoxy-1,4-benzoquinol methylase